MGKALLLLVIVALAVVAVGAVNHNVAFDIDYVAGTVTAVSLFWVAVVFAGLLFVAGAVAAWLAQRDAFAARRKLEKELDDTYRRLREAEAAKAPAQADGPEPASADAAPAAAAPAAAGDEAAGGDEAAATTETTA